MLGVGRRAEDAVIGRRDAGLPHQLLGEDLAPFQLRGFLPRAEDPQALALKDVNNPLGQRLLGPDHRQADPLSLGELEQRRGNRPARSATFCTSIAVPALPGAQKTESTRGDCFNFQQRACSRPPLPITKNFQRTDPHHPGYVRATVQLPHSIGRTGTHRRAGRSRRQGRLDFPAIRAVLA